MAYHSTKAIFYESIEKLVGSWNNCVEEERVLYEYIKTMALFTLIAIALSNNC